MKTGDPETVSRRWQMAHLEYYFGHDRAMSDGKARLVVREERDNQKDDTNSKRACLREVGSVRVGFAKA